MFFFFLGKNRRLKQAKEEAQAEIEQYRLQREKDFKTKEAAVRFLLVDFVLLWCTCFKFQDFIADLSKSHKPSAFLSRNPFRHL